MPTTKQAPAAGDTWTRLAAPLPPEVIRVRVEKDRRGNEHTYRYIDALFVAERLDEAALGRWDFHVGELTPQKQTSGSGNVYYTFHVKATLTVTDETGQTISREDYGSGTSPKAAASDAFKRAAMRFGVGRELYDKGDKGKQPYVPARSAGNGFSAPPSAQLDDPACPRCGGDMWDNRATKRNPKAPDFKCRDRSCDGVIWPPRGAPAESNRSPKEAIEDREHFERVRRQEEDFQDELTGHLDNSDEDDELPF